MGFWSVHAGDQMNQSKITKQRDLRFGYPDKVY